MPSGVECSLLGPVALEVCATNTGRDIAVEAVVDDATTSSPLVGSAASPRMASGIERVLDTGCSPSCGGVSVPLTVRSEEAVA